MRARLVNIMGVPDSWQVAHRIRALEVNGKSPALAGIAECKRDHESDYRQLLYCLKLVGENEHVTNPKRVKRGRRGKKNLDVYEMRGGSARLLFFYTPDQRRIVVCTNYYWKGKGSKREQNRAFKRAEQLRDIYMEYCG